MHKILTSGLLALLLLLGEKHRFWVVRDVFELEGDARPARGQQADFIKVEVRGDDPRFTLRF